jgi:hypothetical protein
MSVFPWGRHGERIPLAYLSLSHRKTPKKLMLEAKGRYWKTDSKLYIYVPGGVVTDSQFPLTGSKGRVQIKVEGKRIIVEKTP